MIEHIVAPALAAHGGGSAYFDDLDERLACDEVFRALLYRLSVETPADTGILVTGRWGRQFAEWYYRGVRPRSLMLLPGGLRRWPGALDLAPALQPGSRWALLDDTLYAGRTLAAIRRWVRQSGADFAGAFVAYDGSPVRSLYRYNA